MMFFMKAEIIIFEEEDIRLEVNMQDETVWLNQRQIATLFAKNRRTISEHIINIFNEGELEESMVCRNFRHTTRHGAIKGKTQEVNMNYYNLDVIISVGYRVKSKRGTQFRIWANKIIKEYLIRGYTVNQSRLDYLDKTVKVKVKFR